MLGTHIARTPQADERYADLPFAINDTFRRARRRLHRDMLFRQFLVRIDGVRLAATLWGEPVDVARHAPACEPKGATYTALNVSKTANGRWSAACIVDV